MLLWTLTKAPRHFLPQHEAEDEEAGGEVAGGGGEVSDCIICHDQQRVCWRVTTNIDVPWLYKDDEPVLMVCRQNG